MRLPRLPLLTLLGVGVVAAACEPDNTPDLTAPDGYTLTAPDGYTLDLRTTPATVTLGTTAADSSTGARVFTAVHNTALADTSKQRLGVLSGGLTYTLRFQDPATDSLKFTFAGGAARLTGNRYGRWAPAASTTVPGLFFFNVRRNRTTTASQGTANVIVEFTDVDNGNQLLADTVRVTAN